jgi:hypothetical protein
LIRKRGEVRNRRINPPRWSRYVEVDGTNDYASIWASAIAIQAEEVDAVARQQGATLSGC